MLLRLPRLALLALVGLLTTLVHATDRPNILWVVSEDNIPLLGSFADPIARTPHLDTLASRGIRFTNTHSPAPVCAPTRASIIAGRYAPGVGTQHMRSMVPLPASLRYFPSYLREAGYYCTNRSKTDYNAEILPDTWDESSARAHWRNRASEQSFFAVFNFTSTHESNLHQRRPLTTDPAAVRVPAYLPDTPTTRADIAQYYDCMTTMDGQIGQLLADLEADGLADDTIIFYYGDHGGVLPRSKRFLYDNGTHTPLIVSFPAKWQHLAPALPGSARDELVTLVDLPATVLSLAGIEVPAGFDGRVIAGPQRQARPDFIYAFRDRMDEDYDLGRAVIGERFRYIRNYRPELPAGQHLEYLWRQASMREWHALFVAGALGDPVQRAFFLPRPPEELYDCLNDPDNIHNLATDPAYRSVLQSMRGANQSHLLAIRDLGFMPEAMMRDRAAGGTPTAVALDESLYPLADCLRLLDTLQLPATPPAEALAAALRDPIPMFRYWAAIAAGRSPELPAELRRLLNDAEPDVRIAAATTLLRRADEAEAWSVLAEALQPDHSGEVRVTAAHALTTLGRAFPSSVRAALTDHPVPAEPVMKGYYERLQEKLLATGTVK